MKLTLADDMGVNTALSVALIVGGKVAVGVGVFDGEIIEVGERLADKFDWEMPIFLPKFMPTRNTAVILITKKRKIVPLAIRSNNKEQITDNNKKILYFCYLFSVICYLTQSSLSDSLCCVALRQRRQYLCKVSFSLALILVLVVT